VKFDHIGVVTESLSAGREQLNSLFGITQWTQEFADPINMVYVQFGIDQSGICYELISPLGPKSPVLEALRSGNRILNHVAYLVPDINAAAARLKAAKCVATGEAKPAVAYGGRKIQFFTSRMRVLVEIIEAIEHSHIYVPPEPNVTTIGSSQA
jgi:methylmalonyl-CoA/ethylmalonyl-CoA epimerase